MGDNSFLLCVSLVGGFLPSAKKGKTGNGMGITHKVEIFVHHGRGAGMVWQDTQAAFGREGEHKIPFPYAKVRGNAYHAVLLVQIVEDKTIQGVELHVADKAVALALKQMIKAAIA